MNDKANGMTDEDLAGRSKALFDDSVAALDGETRSRLNRGRQAALAEIRGRRPAWTRLGPIAGVATAAVVAAVIVGRAPDLGELDAAGNASDLEILLDEDSFEMLEDLEFYTWMELEDLETAAVPQNHVG